MEYEPADHIPVADHIPGDSRDDVGLSPDIDKVNPIEEDDIPERKGSGSSTHHRVNQKSDSKGSLLSEKEISNPNLAKYYSSTNRQPNGASIYENKKDKTPRYAIIIIFLHFIMIAMIG